MIPEMQEVLLFTAFETDTLFIGIIHFNYM